MQLVAQRLCAQPINQGGSERAHEIFGDVCSKKRNRLVTDRAATLTWVKMNLLLQRNFSSKSEANKPVFKTARWHQQEVEEEEGEESDDEINATSDSDNSDDGI